jgi:4-carboxymuconolactone decarboxylase
MTRRAGAVAAVLIAFALASAAAQAPSAKDVTLVGNRFKPLTVAAMTPEQRTVVDHLLAGERASTSGPFNVFLRSPEMADIAQQLGARVRYHSSLPPRLNEMAILLTARHWTAQYEWYAHKRLALQAGLAPAIVDAIGAGKRPPNLPAEERALYEFQTQLLETRQVSDAAFQAAVAAFGERGVVDLLFNMGYYQLVSMVLNADRYPLPEGARPELPAITGSSRPGAILHPPTP